MAIGMCVLSGCGRTKVVLTTGFAKDEVFVIGDSHCYMPEMMVYLSNVHYQYNTVYGNGIWDASVEGVTLEDNVKDTVLAQIAQIKTMYLLAVSKGLTLTEEQEEKALLAAKTYYESLTQEQIEALGITETQLVQMYREYALADCVYDEIIKDINPEISDDEARTVTVQHIYIETCVIDGAGNIVGYTADKRAELYNMAMDIRDQAIAGVDFEELAEKYSDDEIVTISFGRGVMDENIDIAVFNLGTDEISTIVETEMGYHIFKCINTMDRDQTDANKIAIVEKRRKETFENEYNTFVSSLVKNLNEELWDGVDINECVINSTDFFGIFDDIFRE